MPPSIAVLIPFFGPWPGWAPLFFETLRRNHDIDFLVFTDCEAEGLEGANIHVHSMAFQDYVARVNTRIDVRFDPPDPYKLCDLRPLFGHVHEEEFRGYDFYGWCDVDLLFGDIRQFYTDEVLARFDVLSTHEHRISGHFALFRNTGRNRMMFRRIYRWAEALQRPEFVGIDEHGITNAYLMTVVDRFNEKFGLEVANPLTRALARFRRAPLLMEERYTTPFLPRPWLDGSRHGDQPSRWFYRDGHITNSRDGDREFIYLHFMNFKSSTWRHDGTGAPWKDLETVVHATVEDMGDGIVIDERGIRPLGAPR